MSEDEYHLEEVSSPVLLGKESLDALLNAIWHCAVKKTAPRPISKSSIAYNNAFQNVGIPLKVFLGFIESGLFSSIRSVLLRRNNIPQILEEKSSACEPLFTPNTDLYPSEKLHEACIIPRDADGATTAAAAVESLGLENSRSYLRCSALEFHAAYLSNALTPSDVAEAFITAVEESEVMSPPLKLFIEHRPAAIRIAAAESTERYTAGNPLSVLDGVLFGVKDELDVEGYPTTAGTAFLATHRPVTGTIPGVAALLQAGAILAGKLNMHEIGLGTSGLNTVHGTPRNPYNVDYHTGGSSSGAGAAVASGLITFALGTDGGGSIRIPSMFCGIVGLKPTASRICALPSPLITHTVSCCGPMAPTVRDCALLYAMLANKGHEQHGMMPIPPPLALPDLARNALSATRLSAGIYWAWFEHADREVVTACKNAVEVLKDAGLIIKPIVIPHLNDLIPAHSVTITSEMKANLAEYICNPVTRKQLTAEVKVSLAIADGFSAAAYINAQKIRRKLDEAVRHIFDSEKIDFIISPTTPTAAPQIRPASLSGGASDVSMTVQSMRFAQLANMLGLPAITVPVGSVTVGSSSKNKYNSNSSNDKLPVGLQAMAPAWHEASLLRIAEILESHFTPSAGMKPQVYWNLIERAKKRRAASSRRPTP
jgi:Asp-tRNA(Asn)/Glu-tRNA(Gln) amidotransferase A subunit family amidase